MEIKILLIEKVRKTDLYEIHKEIVNNRYNPMNYVNSWDEESKTNTLNTGELKISLLQHSVSLKIGSFSLVINSDTETKEIDSFLKLAKEVIYGRN